ARERQPIQEVPQERGAQPVRPVHPSPPAASPTPRRERPHPPEAHRAPEDGRKTQPEGRQSRERENLR
ncbi:MAG TPA: hypothetical protein PLA97_21990, partial [Rubrivivax sp.]|nr:hypothetical protein [Rubrivivax sp.]